MKLKKLLIISLAFASMSASATPLLKSWQGTGADADKRFCQYGDGTITVISAAENCPLSK